MTPACRNVMPRAVTRYVGNQVRKNTCVELPPNWPIDAPITCRWRSSARTCRHSNLTGWSCVFAAAASVDVAQFRVVHEPALRRIAIDRPPEKREAGCRRRRRSRNRPRQPNVCVIQNSGTLRKPDAGVLPDRVDRSWRARVRCCGNHDARIRLLAGKHGASNVPDADAREDEAGQAVGRRPWPP